MCGICGFSTQSLTREDAKHILSKMCDSLKHRGPDEEGSFINSRIALGIRRLSIVDIEGGSQPGSSRNNDIQIIFNGEIYNYEELFASLRKMGHHFIHDHSEVELLVHLYQEYQLDMVSLLNGMFAIAIYDRNLEKLFLIRDRMGVKPLYFYCDCEKDCDNPASNFIFGSEIKSILHALAIHPKDFSLSWNYHAIYQYFSYKCMQAPNTIYQNIYTLEPGSILTFSFNDFRYTIHRYWQASLPLYPDEVTAVPSLPEAVEHINYLLKDAIRIRLRSNAGFGAFLSGGLDSSYVTACMCNICYEQNSSNFSKLSTYSLLPVTNSDSLYHKQEDSYWATKVAEQYHTIHKEVSLESKTVLEEIPHILNSFDQPFSGPISTYFLAKEAAKEQKVILTGDGADELFGSYQLHQLAYPMQYYRRFKQNYHGLKESEKDFLDFHQIKPLEHHLSHIQALYDYANNDDALLYQRLLTATDEEKQLFLNLEIFGKEVIFEETYTDTKKLLDSYLINNQKDGIAEKKQEADPLNLALTYEWNTALLNQVLTYSDALSMAHSLELRSPFLDYRLVEYVQSLPGNYKIHNGTTKYLLKEASKKILPEKLIHRQKEGFVMPLHDWMKKDFKEFITDTLTYANCKKYGFFNADTVPQLVAFYYNDPVKNDYLADILFNLAMFTAFFLNRKIS